MEGPLFYRTVLIIFYSGTLYPAPGLFYRIEIQHVPYCVPCGWLRECQANCFFLHYIFLSSVSRNSFFPGRGFHCQNNKLWRAYRFRCVGLEACSGTWGFTRIIYISWYSFFSMSLRVSGGALGAGCQNPVMGAKIYVRAPFWMSEPKWKQNEGDAETQLRAPTP